MQRLMHLLPLLIAAAILFIGNGLLLTLVALRSGEEGFSAQMIGIIGTTYFVGFLAGSRFSPRLIEAVGHVRVFAALAAIGASMVLAHILYVDVYAWMVGRAITGFCIAGLFTTIESWLNASAENRDRGRVLSIYSLVDLGAATASQLALPVIGVKGFEVFCLTALFFSLSLVPIALSPTATPRPQEPVRLALKDAWMISPLAFMTCFTIGLTNSSYRAIGPLYASEIGFDLQNVAFFISAGIVGGAVMQLPLGWISDRIDRRLVLTATCCAAALASLFVSTLAGTSVVRNSVGEAIRITTDPNWYHFGSFVFGAFTMPLYSLAAAHANDFAKPNQYAVVSAGLLFTYGIAATVGPLISSTAIETFGPPSLFVFFSLCHGGLVLLAIVRMLARPTVPDEERVRFTFMPRTTPAIFRLARKRLTGNGKPTPTSPMPPDATKSH